MSRIRKYITGEEIKVGDHVYTDNGNDLNEIVKLIDDPIILKEWNLDCYGALTISSAAKGGLIYISFEELESHDSRFIRRGKAERTQKLKELWD